MFNKKELSVRIYLNYSVVKQFKFQFVSQYKIFTHFLRCERFEKCIKNLKIFQKTHSIQMDAHRFD